MKPLFSIISENYKKIVIIILFIIASLLILLIIPHQTRFKYEYQKGKPWTYKTLISPIDFPIIKTKSDIDKERDSIRKNTPLYFDRNDMFFLKTVEILKKELPQLFISPKIDTASDTYKNVLSGCIQIVKELYYNPGIAEFPDSLLKKPSFTLIYVQNDSSTEEEFTYSFITPKEALNEFKHKIYQKYTGILDLSKSDLLPNYFTANIIYNKELSEQIQNQLINNISLTYGLVQKGEKIISTGEIVSKDKFILLESLQHEYQKNVYNPSLILGQLLTILFGMLMIYLFLYHYRKDILSHLTKTSFILSLMIIFILIAKLVSTWDAVSLYLVPFALLPIIIHSFYDSRLALFIHNITILIISYFLPNSFEFLFMQFMVGVTSIFALTNVRRRGQLFLAAIFIFLTYSIIYFGIAIVQSENIKEIEWNNFAWFAGNALMVLAAYPLIYIFEKLFGFLSDVTLLELSDSNQPLLRLLAEKAPGTFQHSLQVANLTEEIILKIGGNPLLARTGALYHDIGKIELPQYFIENQYHIANPHKDLMIDKSIEIIAGHITYGVKLAEKFKLPKPIIEFIYTHHGTSTMLYFYKTYQLSHPGEIINQDMFRYKGQIPQTKETAVLMITDAVEAASHSLKDFSDESLSKMVDHIVDSKLEEHQFDEAPITIKNITETKEILKKRLRNIYHNRVSYPE